MEGPDVPAVPLESEPGDVLVFNHKIKHCAYGGSVERRMFTIGFQQRHRAEDEHILRDELADLVRFWHPRAYGDVMIDTAGPARMRHLEQRLALDDHMTALVQKAREEMAEPSRG